MRSERIARGFRRSWWLAVLVVAVTIVGCSKRNDASPQAVSPTTKATPVPVVLELTLT